MAFSYIEIPTTIYGISIGGQSNGATSAERVNNETILIDNISNGSEKSLMFLNGPLHNQSDEPLEELELLRETAKQTGIFSYHGESGLTAGANLLQNLGFDDFCIYGIFAVGGKGVGYFNSGYTSPQILIDGGIEDITDINDNWYNSVFKPYIIASNKTATDRNVNYIHLITADRQGEANNGAGVLDYYNLRKNNIHEQEAFIKSITGQTENVISLSYQTSWNTLQNNPDPDFIDTFKPATATLDQLRLHEDGVSLITSAIYPFEHKSDEIHTNAKGQNDMGILRGYVFNRVINGLDSGLPYPSRNIQIVDKTITIEFLGDFVEPLLVDKSFWDTTDCGLSVKDKSGINNINTITVSGRNIVLELDRFLNGLEGEREVSYAFEHRASNSLTSPHSGTGDIRDSSIIDPNRLDIRRWLPHFKIAF